MSMVNKMYQTSLKQFLELFDLSMANSQKSPITSKRINNIIEYLTFEVFRYTARGLYEIDKFLYTTLLTCKLELNLGKIRMDEFQTFIKGGAALDLNAVEPKPKKWISDITWLNLVELSKLGQFSQICGQVARNDKVGFDVRKNSCCPGFILKSYGIDQIIFATDREKFIVVICTVFGIS